MKRILKYIFLLLFTTSAFTQDYTELYKDYLPKQIISNKHYSKNVDATIKLYAETDPALIYFYLKNLKLKLEERKTNPDSNFTNILQARLSKAKELKLEWAKRDISLLNNHIPFSIKRFRILKFYANVIAADGGRRIVEDVPEPIDKNLQEYFIYISFIQQVGMAYDSKINYNELVDQYVASKVTELNVIYDNALSLPDSEVKKAIEFAFQKPYLLKGSYLDRFNTVTKFYLYELIDKYYSDVVKKYFDWYSLSMEYTYLEMPLEFSGNFEYSDYFDFLYKYSYNIYTNNTKFIQFGYKQKIRSELSTFSSLNFKFGYAHSISKTTDFKPQNFWEGRFMMPGLVYEGKYYLSEYRKFNSEAYYAQIYTPIYYIFHFLCLEAGVSYFYQSVSLEYDFTTEGHFTNPYGGDVPDVKFGTETIRFKDAYSKYYPFLAMNFIPLKYFTFRVEYLFPKKLVYNSGIHITF